ncbi:reverse transcriptase domain-containing protein [Trichonephila clavipes]|nr:reverse transcriptase domain-containing protein [Trichonephila clavipes]
MARKRAENREGSLGFPGFVKPVFTKDSKPLRRRKRSLGHLGSVKPRTHLKKGTLKQVKSHRCPGIILSISDDSVSPPRIDPATEKHCLVSKSDPPAPPLTSPMTSSSNRMGRGSSLDFFPNNRQATCSGPDEFLAAINSAMNDFDGSKPLCLDAAFHSFSLTPGPSSITARAVSSCPPRLRVFIPSDDELPTEDPQRASTPVLTGVSAPDFNSLPSHPVARGALNIIDSTLCSTPPVVSRLLIVSPATSPTQEVCSLLSLCTRFINRGLAQSQKSIQSPSPVAHREIPASLSAPLINIASQMKPLSQDSTPALPVRNFPFSDAQLTPSPPVLHPLASGVSGESAVSTASIRCLYCEDLFRTQKGLNSHLVTVHKYGVKPRKKRVVFSSPVSSVPPAIDIQPPSIRPILDVPTASTSTPVLNEDDPPAPMGDTTFVISGSPEPRLSRFQKEWIARFNDPSADSLDALVDDLANSLLNQRSAGPSSKHPRRRRTGRPAALSSSVPRSTDASRPEPRTITDRLRYDPRAIPDDFPFPTYPEPVADHFLAAPFVASEVWDKLSHLSDSAPGPDGIRYSVLKNRDPGAHLLTTVFNRVQQSASVPQSWKNSRVVLIFKKGDPLNISNWRPISLLNTMGKIFSSVLASRLSSWATINDRLSPFQKGFRENEGCVEHNFLLEQAIVEAKRSRSDLAFGLRPGERFWFHPLCIYLWFLKGCWCPGFSHQYHHFFILKCQKARFGVAQIGLPQSSMEAGIGLRFNPPKCASLAFFHSKGRRSVDSSDLKILNTPIPSLSGLEAYKYLGLKVGLNLHHDYSSSLFDSAPATIYLKVKNSLLAPWQKLHAIRSIILPRLDFACRNAHVRKSQVERLDKLIVSTAKSIMNLPSRANTTLVHLACRKGGATLPLFRDMLDVHIIGHAFRSLSSPDETVADVARAGLVSVVRKKTRADPDLFVLAEYLNGSSSGRFAGVSSDFSTIWSRDRHAAQRLNKKFSFEWAASDATDSLVLYIHRRPNAISVAPSAANLVVWVLRDELETSYISRLASLPDQGKTIGAVSLHPASNHFIQGGHYTRFCDWNFIHRARLGVLQLNATKRFGRGNPRCRKCGYARETIPHVLNHCKIHSTAWRRRHDAIQNRVSKAIPSHLGTITINKKFPLVSPPPLFRIWSCEGMTVRPSSLTSP